MRADDQKLSAALFLFVSFVLSSGLTLFYFVHEQLPRYLRAPSALLLAPVAVVDGLCYAAGVSRIYGKALPIFIVNILFAAILLGVALIVRESWRRKNI